MIPARPSRGTLRRVTWATRGRSSSSPRAPTARRTTASGSARSCARAATGSCSSSRSRSPGTLEAKGFEERLMRLGPPPEEPEVPGQFWIDFIRDTAPVFRKPTLEQLGEFIAPTWQALIDGAKYVHPRLERDHRRARARTSIVEDNVVVVPGRHGERGGRGSGSCRATRPRSRTRSSRRSRRATRPPTGAAGRRSSTRYRRTHARHVGRLRRVLPRARRRRPGLRASSGPSSSHESPYLNLYSYPAEADYAAGEPARPDLASARLDRPRGRQRPGSCPTHLAERATAR